MSSSVPDRGHLLTEGSHPASAALDTLSIEQGLELFAAADAEAIDSLSAARPQLGEAIELIADRLRRGGRLIYVGAGTSGRLGVLDASECPPTFDSPPEQVQGIIAGGPAAITAAVEGAEDDEQAGAQAIGDLGLTGADVVLGITAGGTTPFVHAALEAATSRGAATVFLACVPHSQVTDKADVSIRLLVGPELITGSTRLKAGTATKLALNAISSLVMVQLGKVFGNRMVDVNTRANTKLVDRGERILMDVLDLERPAAAELLERAQGRAKLAIVMGCLGVQSERGQALLDEASGDLRRALAGAGQGAQQGRD